MTVSALICLATGSEETEAVTIIDLLVRAGIAVTTAAAGSSGKREVRCSRGVRLLADAVLGDVDEKPFDVIVLPGGAKGAEALRDDPRVVKILRRFQEQGKVVAAICAAPAVVLQHHRLFQGVPMTGFPAFKDRIPPAQWRDERWVYHPDSRLLTSQGPGTAMDFALKIIAILLGGDRAADVASQLVLPLGIKDYRH
ncbi:protein deglycase YajL [Martelella alba]|uniref:Protein deglycase YajL n=1 Tax=Martelella alba TaxID=2590451 RepID=A0ABY2SMU8_9HYPH|nr:protein deglycase YajL [Martelella alba]TKI06295.1 protein deglycase YajL [Martelella alba]